MSFLIFVSQSGGSCTDAGRMARPVQTQETGGAARRGSGGPRGHAGRPFHPETGPAFPALPKASRPWSASAWAAKYRLPQRGPSCSPKAGCLGSRGALLVFKHPLLLRFELTSEGRIRTSSQSQSTGPVPWTPAQVGGAQVRGRSTAKVDFSDARGPGPAARGACLPSTEWPKGCSYPPTRPPSSRSSRGPPPNQLKACPAHLFGQSCPSRCVGECDWRESL